MRDIFKCTGRVESLLKMIILKDSNFNYCQNVFFNFRRLMRLLYKHLIKWAKLYQYFKELM